MKIKSKEQDCKAIETEELNKAVAEELNIPDPESKTVASLLGEEDGQTDRRDDQTSN